MKNSFSIRPVTPNDMATLKSLILGLAKHERRPQDVTGTEDEMRHWLFDRKIATALFAEFDGQPIGYAIYYPVYGSYSARGRVYIEDIYFKPEVRGKGYGTKLLAHICKKALEEGYIGLEWSALDFNTGSIDYYLKLGAEKEKGRTYFDFSKECMEKLIARVSK